MCSRQIMAVKKETVKLLGDMTKREFLQFAIEVKNPSECRILLTNTDISILSRMKLRTVNHYSSQQPERLPRRFEKSGSRAVRYLFCEWHRWSMETITDEAPPTPSVPAPPPAQLVKRGPGRPPGSSRCNS